MSTPLICPKCGGQGFEPSRFASLFRCVSCGANVQLPIPTVAEQKQACRRRKKESIHEERKLADTLGLKHHGDSGAAWYRKGDMSGKQGAEELIVSQKTTSRLSFPLRIKDIEEMLAWSKGKKLPFMVVKFSLTGQEVAILTLQDLRRLLDGATDHSGPGESPGRDPVS